jgi:hypothetical protein
MNWKDRLTKGVTIGMVGLSAVPVVVVNDACARNEFCRRIVAYIPDEETRLRGDPLSGKDRTLKIPAATSTSASLSSAG